MKNKIVVSLAILVLILGLFQITLNIKPVVFGGESTSRREIWQIVNVTNTHGNMTTSGDIKVAVSNSTGVNIAWSTNITKYYWNESGSIVGYNTYMEWLNGTSALPYHWGEMNWYVTQGSLTNITWDEIKYWWDMYSDPPGAGGNYKTFMGNTYMADCNLTDPSNDPDIIGPEIPWSGASVIIKDLVVPAKTTIYFVFKIVITKAGAYSFNLTSPNPLLEISPPNWVTGGVGTLVVGNGPAYEYNTIQVAINAASAGDTIIVSAGTYSGAIVNKSVTISGGLGGASIITSGVLYRVGGPTLYTAFRLDAAADGAKISSFAINCSSSVNFYFAIFGRDADNVTINSLTVNDAVQGITNWGGSNWNITNNVLNNTEAAGGGGIAIYFGAYPPDYPVCSGNLVQNNTITATATAPDYTCPGIGVGLDLRSGRYDLLTGSEDLSNNQILNNNITAPGALNGVGIEIGVLGLEGNTTKIAAVLGVIHNNTIQGNNIEGADLGIFSYTVTDMKILKNEIKNCNEGIHIKDSINGSIINYNNIFGNAMGINNTAREFINARFNWWGNETGPYNSTLNPTGLGDKVSGNVDFKPWLIKAYPPAVPVSEMYVKPQLVQCWTSLNKTFTVKVVLDNIKLLYGFEFKLRWNRTLLNLTGATYGELWGAYPNTYPWQNAINNTIGEYWLALSGTGSVPPFNANATLATLTFKIIYEPVYPNNVTSDLALVDTLLTSTKNLTAPERILHVVYIGTYWCNFTLPTITTGKPTYIIERTPYLDPGRAEMKKLDVDINVTNVVNLQAFDFNLTYDPYFLEFANAWEVHVPCTNPFWGSWNDANGRITLFGHAEGIPSVNGTVTLATFKFKVPRYVSDTVPAWFVWNTVNRTYSCALAFTYTNLTGPGNTPIQHVAVNGTYLYKPVPGDLDMSGAVDIIDLAAAAKVFGLSSGDPGWRPERDVYVDGVINIFDIIIIARNFGRTEPEP